MKRSILMPAEYLELARLRSSLIWPHYHQVEEFGYDFKDWVSPYTRGAHQYRSVALVLQDWSSSDKLAGSVDPEIQENGRTLNLKTNIYLEELLKMVFGISIQESYGTNVFPFVKRGGMSKGIPRRHVRKTAFLFTKSELNMAQPEIVLALGRVAQFGLSQIGIPFLKLPHPAARIGGIEKHAQVWRKALSNHRQR